ncbi:hypothetical protein [Solimonas marina]|uniref:Uncharacterized protein n=1 Tax=Solimonas marina TaxID=2714601 RepID=A0A969W845_9GAMM|nr:hypothetical protein [Solimonas marina]NKF21733.1 hypothetical protein [Solimonas marina]
MKPKEIERWKKRRDGGMLRFIGLAGVLAWGVPMFVAMTFFVPHPKLSVPECAILWLCAGGLYGAVMWFVQEHRYRKAMEASGD